ncbi:hypothetical protein C0V75_18130 [Tabrizicola sp. TH137]|uniref:hypothetical protein n=1 Tax=Tabrizicola sp. TH137 TaxID=2067452 RepID=UPI000C7AA5F9|nr:hypothetical protein [Tabrizicola sp. TH137]PLL11198.1 hypothetical protein C0V75_18130 [Tabrizicola sp. TH137]
MTDGVVFTDLEDGLFGPDGTSVLRMTAGRIIALRQAVSAQIDDGLPPEDSMRSRHALAAIDAAERILIHLTHSGD